MGAQKEREMHRTKIVLFDSETITVVDHREHHDIAAILASTGYCTTTRTVMGKETPITLMKGGVISLTPE